MKKIILFTFLPIFLLATVTTTHKARAIQVSGIYLLELCGKNENGSEIVVGGHAACQAYIAGVIDYHSILQAGKALPNLSICIPETVTLSELHDVVLNYLQNSPQHDSFAGAPVVTLALRQIYKCDDAP